MPRCRYQVSGRVQGVCYRTGTQEHAKELGLKGWVRNLNNGDVELEVSGPVDRLETLEHWLWQGPSEAEVMQIDVEVIEEEPSNEADFKIRH
ncbi:acylphosphatase [Agaribacterium sp. ZY112]|uniref:acylphosphatase n=1 Tax=Agaribacterium sp. ZY112 TaxID=3233574 RepID=UPI0035232144